jgi:hypothetical protein
MMKKLAVFAAIALVALSPAFAGAQTAASFSGKWEGTMIRNLPDGTQGNPGPVVFNLTQKGTVISGTAGPGDQLFPVSKGGTVAAGKAKFDVQQPNGPLFKFTLSIVKGRLTGEAVATGPDGSVRGTAKIDAAKAAAGAKK